MKNSREYKETMEKLTNPDDWDVYGVIQDVQEDLASSGMGSAVAVIDALLGMLDAKEDELRKSKASFSRLSQSMK